MCTRAISEAFAAGPEYFNTFGGNPVCAAAGLAVLDAIEADGLRARALAAGDELRRLLRALAASDAGSLIGDVRGAGLFVGIEFVRDRRTLEPATAETSRVCSQLKDAHRILTSIDGPHDNVIVLKPPMCFGVREAARFVEALRVELGALVGLDLSSVRATPT